jgi:acylpyruvate hydrolase
MRLVTFSHNGQPRLGALVASAAGERVIDLARAQPRLPADMLAFLEAGPDALNLARQTVAAASPEEGLDAAAVSWLAPVPRPGKIIAIGQNYAAHAAEGNAPPPQYPIVFAKYANTVIGHKAPIVLPRISSQVDYEGELGVVIGRRAKAVSEEAALSYVAGYLCFHDVSARDYQMLTSQWTLGKTFDTFAPMGPALVTADEVPDPQALRVRTVVSGEVLQDGHTGDMIFSVAFLVAYLSAVMTLEPGDVIATGTPPGVGMARKPPRWLRPGDVVRIEIDGVGVLENPVVAES